MTYERVTFLFSLPRSGTQWLAWLYGHAITAWHDPLKNCGSIRELKEKVDAVEGRLFIADTSALLFHDQIVEAFPGANRLCLWRPAASVLESIKAQNISVNEKMISKMSERLLDIAKPRRALADTAAFPFLYDFAYRNWAAVTSHAPLDRDWFEACCQTKIDKPLPEQYRLINAAKARRLFAQREIARY